MGKKEGLNIQYRIALTKDRYKANFGIISAVKDAAALRSPGLNHAIFLQVAGYAIQERTEYRLFRLLHRLRKRNKSPFTRRKNK